MLAERIKELRKALNLSQEQFAKQLGLSTRWKLVNIELGRVDVDEAFINLVCATYNVNKQWLMTGEGEMFRELSKEQEIINFLGDSLSDGDTVKRRIISALARLTPEQWELVAQITDQLVAEYEKEKTGD